MLTSHVSSSLHLRACVCVLCARVRARVLTRRRAGVEPGKCVAILGAGPIGLVTLLAAKAFGADAVAITDVAEGPHLELARSYGGRVVCVGPGDSAEHVAELVAAALPEAPQAVIDCAGFSQTVEMAVRVCAPGGKAPPAARWCWWGWELRAWRCQPHCSR